MTAARSPDRLGGRPHGLQIHVLADDHVDDRLLAHGGGLERAGDPPVAQHGGAAGDLQNFVDVVGHEDDARAGADDLANQAKQRVDVVRGQERGRFIKHQEPTCSCG